MVSENSDMSNSHTMKLLEDGDIRQICAGQIITTLAVAIKELIENSLDAGARHVEVILKDYGSTVIEVQDNGSGVEKDNRPYFALKNYTSKITQFVDVYDLQTYGFRGEAVNSLCTIADVSVITRHKDDDIGVLLVFDRSGYIVDEKPHPRMVGTSVIVKNIFYPFPVRRKLLLSCLKKEFSKAIDMIKAYGLISVGTRIVCSHHIGEKSSSTILVSDGTSVMDNIRSSFGADQVKSLLTISSLRPDQSIMDDFKITEEEANKIDFSIEGYISSCGRSEGRSSRDRQFLFINSRPCDYEKITKLINSIYHQYQKRKYPFVFLNIKLPPDSIDVNCSPDKREIFIRNEKLVLATIKASLLALYGTAQATLDTSKLPTIPFPVLQKPVENSQDSGIEVSSVNGENDLTLVQSDIVEEGSNSTLAHEEDICVEKDECDVRTKIVVYDENKKCSNGERRETVMDCSLLIKMMERTIESECEGEGTIKCDDSGQRFKTIFDPAKNEDAEDELRLLITRDMFKKMDIIGQFNNSFIIVSFESNVFIIDQHAADEKFNFERLMKTHVLPSQRLAVPRCLEISPSQEQVILDYKEVFKKNGFDFMIDDSAQPLKVMISAVPLTKTQALGKEDFAEILTKLEECPDVRCRPSKVRAMYASRACRMSIMMGTALSESIMRKIVDHMGDLDDPWAVWYEVNRKVNWNNHDVCSEAEEESTKEIYATCYTGCI